MRRPPPFFPRPLLCRCSPGLPASVCFSEAKPRKLGSVAGASKGKPRELGGLEELVDPHEIQWCGDLVDLVSLRCGHAWRRWTGGVGSNTARREAQRCLRRSLAGYLQGLLLPCPCSFPLSFLKMWTCLSVHVHVCVICTSVRVCSLTLPCSLNHRLDAYVCGFADDVLSPACARHRGSRMLATTGHYCLLKFAVPPSQRDIDMVLLLTTYI